jgi:hypothetical protein
VPTVEPEQLPFWPKHQRGGPNALLRSALFAGIQSKRRRIIGVQTSPDSEPEGELIAAQNGIIIRYAGTQLNQDDANVFFEAADRARNAPLGTECTFTGYEFLRELDRAVSKGCYDDLDASLRRMRRGELEVEWSVNGHNYVFTGSLIASYIRETTTKRYKVTFAPEVSVLFATASWTQIEWEERKSLKGQPLAQWLHSYYSTHATPYPLSAAFIHEKSGSSSALLKNFKIDLKRAFKVLHDKLSWNFEWNGDLVTVKRPPSAAQAQHIQRKLQRVSRIKKETVIAKRNEHCHELTAISNIFPGLFKP